MLGKLLHCLPLAAALGLAAGATQAVEPGEEPALEPHIDHEDICDGDYSYKELRRHGRRIFSTPFNKMDGYGDGPMNGRNSTEPGGRPSLQNNGTFLRVNGLDAQTCLECHAVLSNAEIPFKFGVGGVGGSNSNAIIMPTDIDVADSARMGFADFNGRFANPPFLFGSGGVELLAKEMTVELQALKEYARRHPETVVDLITKGVDFGHIVFTGGTYDTSGVEGIDHDLVVRPFGRKGEFATVRAFDLTALQFHMGMQPMEVVGVGVDADGDGVTNEVHPGDLSALSIFLTSLERPERRGDSSQIHRGEDLFTDIGCERCHCKELTTDSRYLTLSFPEVETDPEQNIYYEIDLSKYPAKFEKVRGGGVRVPLFSDLKRHDMGPVLAESAGHRLDSHFITARLWGLRDTAPYMHDGRATTITEAILLHGGEAEPEKRNFEALDDDERRDLLAFLRSLRTPRRLGR